MYANSIPFYQISPYTSLWRKTQDTNGEQDIEEMSASIQFGKLASSDRNSLNRSIKTRPVVLPSQIQNLPDLQAYLKLCDLNPTLIHFDYRPLPQRNLANCSERSSLSLSSSNQKSLTSSPPAEPKYDFNPNEKNKYDFDASPSPGSRVGSEPASDPPDAENQSNSEYDFDASESDSDDNFLKF